MLIVFLYYALYILYFPGIIDRISVVIRQVLLPNLLTSFFIKKNSKNVYFVLFLLCVFIVQCGFFLQTLIIQH